MPKIFPRLGLALLYLRKALGYSGTELAKKLGVAASLISDYETGQKELTRERLEEAHRPLGPAARRYR